ncbi:GNAT family N-acetyltransferase [Actinomadura decatromicini]|uniref:GNAT family N-acetyltransferase n=1 Tax=Actinomadura decatromicini TaxID=2604572 RepID=A0A5D3FW95_9ACTN|nr:GNAT family N-acetyltransferase [Actinomadura decatromicini]TYK52394.1 GNAT family N-acetyltransferase [Actinomadura decatromicini]
MGGQRSDGGPATERSDWRPCSESADVCAPRVRVVGGIGEVEAECWNALAGADDFYMSHEWLASIERDRVARVRYVLALAGDRLIGALPIYRLLYEGGTFYQNQRFRTLLGIEGDHLVAGSRLCNRGGVLLADDLRADVGEQTVRVLLQAALAVAEGEGLHGIVLPYLPAAQVQRIRRAAWVVAARDDAEAIVSGASVGVDAYVERLPKKRRYYARQERDRYAKAGWRSGVEPLAGCVPEVARLVSEVNRRHGDTVPDFLLRRIFRWEARAVGPRAVVLTCRDERGALVACAVDFVWRDMLYLHAVGLDHERLRDSFEYFNLMIYRAIEYASEQGLDRLHLGLVTRAKTLRGAVANPLWTAAVLCGTAGRAPGVRFVDGSADTGM